MQRFLLALVVILLVAAGLGLWLLSKPLEPPSQTAAVSQPETVSAPIERRPRAEPLERSAADTPEESEVPAAERESAVPTRSAAERQVATHVRGNIFSSDRGPLGGARARALLHVGDLWEELGAAQSSADGIYRIDTPLLAGLGDMAPGPEVWVHISAPGHQDLTLRANRDPRTPDSWQASGRLLTGASLVGRVVDSGGEPVMDAEVNFEAMFDTGTATAPIGRRGPRPVRTGADGRFRIGVPTAHIIRVDARHGAQGFAVRPLDLKEPSSDHDVGDLQLGARQILRGVVHYPNGAPARGLRLVAQRIRDPRDRSGQGLGEQSSSSMSPQSSRSGPFLSRSRTDNEGRFEFLDLEQGSYTITEQDENIPGLLMRSKTGPRKSWGRPSEGGPFPVGSIDLNLLCEARRVGIVLRSEAERAGLKLAGLALIPSADQDKNLERLPVPGGAAFSTDEIIWFRLQPHITAAIVAWAPGRGSDRDGLVLHDLGPAAGPGEEVVELVVE